MDTPDTDPRIRDFIKAFAPQTGQRLWHGGPSLFGSLRGVDAAHAAWHPSGHAHSLWQLLLHCTYSRYNIRRHFEGQMERGGFPRRGGYWPDLPDAVTEKTWKNDIALLKQEHARLVKAVQQFDPARLDEHATQQWTYADLLWGIVMHDMLHVGEMQVMKQIYRLHNGK